MKQIVKIQAHDKFPYKLVEWKLHDKCNYDCIFCGEENKAGHKGWDDFESNKMIVDSIVKSAEGEPLWIQLTGGEPTLYPKFLELVQYIKEQGAYVCILSNGSRTLRWWKQFQGTRLIDMLFLTFHSQQKADYKHIEQVSNLFLNDETIVVCIGTYTADSIDYLIEGMDYILDNTGNYITTNAMDLGTDNRITEEDIGKEKFDILLNHINLTTGKLYETLKVKIGRAHV